MLIPFNRLNALLASVHKDYCFDLRDSNYEVTFVEYIRSQIHFNILSSLRSRDYKEYLGAYSLLEDNAIDDEQLMDSFRHTLGFFYNDMSFILHKLFIKNDYNELPLDISVATDLPEGILYTKIGLDEVKNEIKTYLNGGTTVLVSSTTFNSFDMKFIDTNKDSDTFALILMFKELGSKKEIEIIEVI